MKRAHDRMTFDRRGYLQFWIGANGWKHWYIERNGEMAMPDSRWENELDGHHLREQRQRVRLLPGRRRQVPRGFR
jgi:hypothetical protein